jgi:transposase
VKRSSNKSAAPPPRAKRTFSDEFKAEAVALMRRRRAEGVSLSQIGRELGIGHTLLWEWARKLDGGGTGPVPEPGPGRLPGETLEEENRRLRRENAILRQEREFAKKAAAFFARESL